MDEELRKRLGTEPEVEEEIYNDSEKEDSVVIVDFEPDEEEPEKSEEELQEEERRKAREEAKDKKLAELLKELAVTQSQKMIVIIAKDAREMQSALQEKSDKLKEYLENQASAYGANKPEIDGIVQQYKNNLNVQKSTAENEYNKQLEELIGKQNAEKQGIKNLRNAKKEKKKSYKQIEQGFNKTLNELKEAYKLGDNDKIEELKVKLERQRKVRDKFDKDINTYRNDVKVARQEQKTCKEAMKKAKNNMKVKFDRNKVNKLVEKGLSEKGLTKQKGINKFVGWISNMGKKIGGNSSFKKKVLNPIVKAMASLTEEVKSIPSNASAKAKKIMEEAKTRMQMAINENIQAREEIQNSKEASKESEGPIIE